MLGVSVLITGPFGGCRVVVAMRGLGRSNDDLAEIYQERLVPVSQLGRINDLMHVSVEQLIDRGYCASKSQ